MFKDWKNIIKMSILQKAINKFSTIPIKIPMPFFFFFTEVGKNIPKICIEPLRTPISQRNIEKEQSRKYHTYCFQAVL